MNDDGSMARLKDLKKFAYIHKLKIGTISDLIAYRRKHDNLIKEVESSVLNSSIGGKWKVIKFRDEIENLEHIVLKLGKINTTKPAMVRMHKLNIYKDLLGLVPSRYNEIGRAMQKIIGNENGILVLLNSGDSSSEKPSSDTLKEYGIGAQILSLLGVKRIKLLSNSKLPKVVGLEGYGLQIDATEGF